MTLAVRFEQTEISLDVLQCVARRNVFVLEMAGNITDALARPHIHIQALVQYMRYEHVNILFQHK